MADMNGEMASPDHQKCFLFLVMYLWLSEIECPKKDHQHGLQEKAEEEGDADERFGS